MRHVYFNLVLECPLHNSIRVVGPTQIGFHVTCFVTIRHEKAQPTKDMHSIIYCWS
jgi:hypothetical protein